MDRDTVTFLNLIYLGFSVKSLRGRNFNTFSISLCFSQATHQGFSEITQLIIIVSDEKGNIFNSKILGHKV